MSRTTRRLVFVLLSGMIVSATAWAQIAISATLPFAFQVEETKFSQGAYLLSQDNPDKKITIRNQKGKQSGEFASSPLPPQSLSEPDQTWLVFHRYDEQYFLAEIWSHHIGRQMTVSSAEKQLLSAGKMGKEVRVNLKIK